MKSLVTSANVHSVQFCNYDQIYKIIWEINGKKTYSFSSRGKRIGETVSPAQKAAEQHECYIRGQAAVDYLLGKISRTEAVKKIKSLKNCCPRDPSAHLLTLVEFALGIRTN